MIILIAKINIRHINIPGIAKGYMPIYFFNDFPKLIIR